MFRVLYFLPDLHDRAWRIPVASVSDRGECRIAEVLPDSRSLGSDRSEGLLTSTLKDLSAFDPRFPLGNHFEWGRWIEVPPNASSEWWRQTLPHRRE